MQTEGSSEITGQASSSSTTQTKEKINITEWLKKNKLDKIEKIFKERDLSVEELCEFNDTELNDFASELQLDTLGRKRFIKAIEALRPPQESRINSTFSSTTQPIIQSSINVNIDSSKMSMPSSLPLIVSPQEQNAIQKLHITYDTTAKLINEIQNSFDLLELSTSECKKVIESTFESLAKDVENKKQSLISQSDLLKNRKSQQLLQQADSLKQYNIVLDSTKSKYDAYVKDQTLDIQKRKKMILEMISEIMKYPGISLLFITQPKMIMKDYKPVLLNFFQGLMIDDCDQPMPFTIWVTKVLGDEITVEWRINERDIQVQSTKPILAISVEWTALPKTDFPKADSKIFEKAKQKPSEVVSDNNDNVDKTKRQSKIASLFSWFTGGDSKDHVEAENNRTTTDEEIEKDKEKDNKDSKDKEKKKGKGGKSKDKKKKKKDSDDDDDDDDKSDKSDKSDNVESDKSDESDNESKSESKEEKSDSDSEKSDKSKDDDSDDDSDKEKKKKDKKKDKNKDKDKDKDEKEKEKEILSDSKEEKSSSSNLALANDFQSILESIEESKLKWKTNDDTIKPKARKYKIKNLKDETPYAIRIRAKNVSGWGIYSQPVIFWTPKLTIDSKIMKAREKVKLMKFVPKSHKFKWKLIYRASKDGFSAYNFHTKCNSKGPTVTVVKSKMNHVFGGFTEVPWTSNGNYANDPNAFIFLLRSSRKDKPEKFACKNTTYSLNHNGSYGPTFGGGHDFYLCDNCNTVQSSYSNFGHSYGQTTDQSKLAGSYNFLVDEFEVYHLKK